MTLVKVVEFTALLCLSKLSESPYLLLLTMERLLKAFGTEQHPVQTVPSILLPITSLGP